MDRTAVHIPVGDGVCQALVPNLIRVVSPVGVPGTDDPQQEIRRAIRYPIGTPRLCEIARGKRSAAIVVNDITRPYPGRIMIKEIAEELHLAGMTDEQIFLVVAYGNHRKNTDAELAEKYGQDVLRRFRIVHHRATEPDTLIDLGKTEYGMPVQLNRAFCEAEVKILTGCIAPHQMAGFSGGRKSVMPGIAGIESLKIHHSLPIRPAITSSGWLEGNRFHTEAMAAARMAGVDFIVNSVDNEKRELVACVAGDLEDAYMQGVEISRRVWTVSVPCKPDVVIVSPGGFPRDFDLHQSQKAIGCAEMICKEGGMIILCAECRDGSGKPGKVLQEAASPQEVIDRFIRFGYTPDAVSKAFMLARALTRFRVAVAESRIPTEDLREMFLEGYGTLQEAIEAALGYYGQYASFLVVPHASEIMAVVSAP